MRQRITGPAVVAEIDELLRTMPNFLNDPVSVLAEISYAISRPAWLGRFAAVMKAIDPIHLGTSADGIISGLNSQVFRSTSIGRIPILLHEARYQAQLASPEGTGVAIAAGAPYQYFNEVRKIIETANEDVLFVDPYMGADFVDRYLPHLKGHVRVRLLSREQMPKLLSAVGIFVQETPLTIEVRSGNGFHDRHLIIDGRLGYHSGASFKDGAATAPTTLTPVIDLFAAVQTTCEALWAAGTPRFPLPATSGRAP